MSQSGDHPQSLLALLPADLYTIILTFLPLQHKFLHCSRLSHLHHRLLSPAAFRLDHVSIDAAAVPCLFRPHPPAALCSVASLSLGTGVGVSAIPHSVMTLLLSDGDAFFFRSLRLLSLQLHVANLTALLRLIGERHSPLARLQQLHVLSDALERGRTPPCLASLERLPRLTSLRLSYYRLAQAALSLLLSLPSLTALSLQRCSYAHSKDAFSLSRPSPLTSLSLPTADLRSRELDINAIIAALPTSLQRLRVSGTLPLFSLLSSLPHLRVLDLSHCQFSPLFMAELTDFAGALAGLRQLSLSQYSTALTSAPEPERAHAKGARHTLTTSPLVSFLEAFHFLHSLDLLLPSYAVFTASVAVALAGVQQLRSLKLSRAIDSSDLQPITEEVLKPIAAGSMTALRCLELHRLLLDDRAVAVLLRAAPALQHLTCQGLPTRLGVILLCAAHCRDLRTLQLKDSALELTTEAFDDAEALLSVRWPPRPFASLALVSLHLQAHVRVDSAGLYRLITLLPAVTHFALRAPHLIAHDVHLLSNLPRLRALALTASRSLAGCLRVYHEGGQGRVYTRKRRAEHEFMDDDEDDDVARLVRACLEEWTREFVEEEVHAGLDGRAAFFSDLSLQMQHEREREAVCAERDKQRKMVEQHRRDAATRARTLTTVYRPPARQVRAS